MFIFTAPSSSSAPFSKLRFSRGKVMHLLRAYPQEFTAGWEEKYTKKERFFLCLLIIFLLYFQKIKFPWTSSSFKCLTWNPMRESRHKVKKKSSEKLALFRPFGTVTSNTEIFHSFIFRRPFLIFAAEFSARGSLKLWDVLKRRHFLRM